MQMTLPTTVSTTWDAAPPGTDVCLHDTDAQGPYLPTDSSSKVNQSHIV
jgi:hypothetical protein